MSVAEVSLRSVEKGKCFNTLKIR